MATTNLLSVSMDLHIVNISYKESHTVYVTFPIWLLSLTRMILNFIHVVTCIRTSFVMAEECSIGIWIYHIWYMDIPHLAVSTFWLL